MCLFLESDVRRVDKQQQPQTSGMLSSVSILQHSYDAEKNVKPLLKLKSQHPEKSPQQQQSSISTNSEFDQLNTRTFQNCFGQVEEK